jgi:hypothetical protein
MSKEYKGDSARHAANAPLDIQASGIQADCNGRLTSSSEEGPFYKTGS